MTALRRRTVGGHLQSAFLALPEGILRSGQVRFLGGKLRAQALLLVAQGQVALGHTLGGIGKLSALVFRLFELLRQLGCLSGDFGNTPVQGLDLLPDAAAAAVLLGKLGLDALDIGKAVFAVGPQNGNGALDGLDTRLALGDTFAHLVRQYVPVV